MDAYSKCSFLRGFQTHNKEDFMRKIAIKMPMKVTQLEEIQTVVNLHTKSVYSYQVSRHIIKKFLREKSPLRYQQKWLSLELPQPKSLYRSRAGRHFYGTENEIWAGFGPVGITEKTFLANYEQLFRAVFLLSDDR